jgi:hypothetical protein
MLCSALIGSWSWVDVTFGLFWGVDFYAVIAKRDWANWGISISTKRLASKR